jgi:hypothetical protein
MSTVSPVDSFVVPARQGYKESREAHRLGLTLDPFASLTIHAAETAHQDTHSYSFAKPFPP